MADEDPNSVPPVLDPNYAKSPNSELLVILGLRDVAPGEAPPPDKLPPSSPPPTSDPPPEVQKLAQDVDDLATRIALLEAKLA